MDVELDGLFRHNTTYDYNDDYRYVDESESWDSQAVWLPLVYSVVLVAGLVGNGLLLYLLVQRRQTCRVSDIFVLHLSIGDVLLLVTLPLWASQAAQRCGWCLGVSLCRLTGAVFKINFYHGLFLLLCITLDRYLSVVHSKQLFTRKDFRSVHISCLLVWLVSLLFTIPDWVFLDVEKHPWREEGTLCVPSVYQPTRQLPSRLVHHVICFAATGVVWCLLILLWRQRSSASPQKQRPVVVLLAQAAAFFLCWMPYNIALTADTFSGVSATATETGSPASSQKASLTVTFAFGCVHAGLRPLLYLGLCRNFRKWTLAALRCAAVELRGSVWELGVGDGETQPRQTQAREEQIACVEQQVQLVPS